ncbi:MAG: hypothetical protein M3O15_09375, partial [Acidobacteriota bacterium]|nr:hypothetical protein [Acidobacteriota bacterium]
MEGVEDMEGIKGIEGVKDAEDIEDAEGMAGMEMSREGRWARCWTRGLGSGGPAGAAGGPCRGRRPAQAHTAGSRISSTSPPIDSGAHPSALLLT